MSARPSFLLASSLALLVPAGAAVAATPATVAAPGRVVLPATATVSRPDLGVGGAGVAVTLPDGGAVLAGGDGGRGLVLARVTAQGVPDPSFGTAGVARVALPAGDPSVVQLLRRPDGRLLVVIAPRTGAARPVLQVVGLTETGVRDPAFGTDGIAPTGMQAACTACEPAALTPDGGLVAGGVVGDAGAVVRLTQDGRVDDAFGTVRIPGATGEDGGVYATSATASRVTVLARGASGMVLTALDTAGRADGSFAAGTPQPVADAPALSLLVHEDGVVDVLGQASISRFTADGQPDGRFGTRGVVGLSGAGPFAPRGRLLAGGDASTLIVRPGGLEPRLVGDPSLVARRVTRTGEVQAVASPALGFGGGYASPGGSTRLLLGGVDQDGFLLGQLLRRPDGGFLAAGGTAIIRSTGPGRGSSRGFFAVAGLTGALRPDPTFGGPTRPAAARVRVLPQRAGLDARTRRIRLRVRPTTPGLVLLRVRDAAGRVLAQVVAPLPDASARTVRVPLTPEGRRLLQRGRRTPVVVGHVLRDLAGGTGAGSTPGVLR